jgi:hypothetical protein
MVKSYYPVPLPKPEKAHHISAFSIAPKKVLYGSAVGQFNGNTKFFGTVQQARVSR